MRHRSWVSRVTAAALAVALLGGCSAVEDGSFGEFLGDLARGAAAAWLL